MTPINALNFRSPDLICIGAQKAATTWLYEALKRQTDIFLPPIKELHYFSELYNDDARKYGPRHRIQQIKSISDHLLGIEHKSQKQEVALRCLRHLDTEFISDEWYKGIFGFAGDNEFAVDICPGYMNLPVAGVKHAMRVNPLAKILLILRDPIDRSWSHIRMHVKQGVYEGSLHDLVDGTKSLYPYLFYSDYSESMRKWMASVPRENFKYMFHDDVSDDSGAALEEICGFIGLNTANVNHNVKGSVHVGKKVDFPISLRRALFENLIPQYEFLETLAPDMVAKWKSKHEAILNASEN